MFWAVGTNQSGVLVHIVCVGREQQVGGDSWACAVQTSAYQSADFDHFFANKLVAESGLLNACGEHQAHAGVTCRIRNASPVHDHPSSIVQYSEHPSPGSRLPSSHCSCAATNPLPPSDSTHVDIPPSW